MEQDNPNAISAFSLVDNLSAFVTWFPWGGKKIRPKRERTAPCCNNNRSRRRRGYMDNKAQCINHPKSRGSCSAKRLAGKRGSRIDFSCTANMKTQVRSQISKFDMLLLIENIIIAKTEFEAHLDKRTNRMKMNYLANYRGTPDHSESSTAEQMKVGRPKLS